MYVLAYKYQLTSKSMKKAPLTWWAMLLIAHADGRNQSFPKLPFIDSNIFLLISSSFPIFVYAYLANGTVTHIRQSNLKYFCY